MIQTRVTKDITQFGYMTTIGLAQFHEQLLNRVVKPIASDRGGRPTTVYTGRRGRPAKLKPLKAKPRGRTSGRKGFGVVSADGVEEVVSLLPYEIYFSHMLSISLACRDDDHNDYVPMDADDPPYGCDDAGYADLSGGGSECIEDEDDNAGDADTSGDGSECIGDPFGAYDDLDSEDADSADSDEDREEGDMDEEIPESMETENVMEVDSEDQ